MQKLMRYSWPGNVRELQNTIERSLILSKGYSIKFQLPDEYSSDSGNEFRTSAYMKKYRSNQRRMKSPIACILISCCTIHTGEYPVPVVLLNYLGFTPARCGQS